VRAGSVVAQAIASCVAVLLIAPSSRAQTPPAANPATSKINFAYRYRLLGAYDDASGDPVEGVEVSDVLNGSKSLTTSTGTVSLIFLPEGLTLVRLRKVGYEVQTLTVAISPADTSPITIVMKRAVQLPTVVVTDSTPHHRSPALNAFEEHKKAGLGQFVEEAFFRKNDDRTLAQALAPKLSGVHMIITPSGANYLVSSRTQCSGPALAKKCNAPNCYVRVFLDGVLSIDNSGGPAGAMDLNHLDMSTYAAAEFYPGGAALPVGVSSGSSECGTLMLYTREK
jgi:hypothetical protein